MKKSLIAVLCLLLFVALLPTVLSTSIGKPLFVRLLEKKSQAKVEIGALSLSWFGPQKFEQIHWTRGPTFGNVEEFEIQAPFWSFEGPFHLKNGSITYKNSTVNQIEGQMEGNDFALTGTHLSLQGKIYSKSHFDIQVNVQNFPLAIIDKRLDEILGPVLNVKGMLSSSSIDLDIASQNVTTQLRGILNEDSITLREPLKFAIRLTPELSDLLLKDVNPFFLTSIEAKNPVAVQIATKDFFFPLPFSLDRLRAQGTLDLGQAECKTGKVITTVIHFLKGHPLQEIEAWFTKVAFRVDEGVLETGRMDALLAHSIHICTWGKVDLLKDQIHMFLGIPADTLRKSLNISNLPPTYVLEIPIRGSTREPEIVKGPAIAKISALVAGKQISKKGFLGNISDLFTDKEEQLPPPAIRPFPWESDYVKP